MVETLRRQLRENGYVEFGLNGTLLTNSLQRKMTNNDKGKWKEGWTTRTAAKTKADRTRQTGGIASTDRATAGTKSTG